MPAHIPDSIYYTTVEAAALLGKSDSTVRRHCRQGAYPGKIQMPGYGSTWLIPERDLEDVGEAQGQSDD